MATKIYLTDAAPPSLSLGSGTRALSTTPGAAQTNSDATATAAGPTAALPILKGGQALRFTSAPVNAFTMSGSVTINIWGLESNIAANAQLAVAINIYTGAGAFFAQPYYAVIGAELPTAVAAQNWTITPTSTAVPQGAIIGVSVLIDDAPALNMGAGFTATLSYNGGTGAANGDSWVQFTETVTFVGGAAPVNTILPSISGTPGVGNVLTGNTGTWTGATSISAVWKQETGTVVGSSGTYTQQATDVGHTLTYEATATNPNGNTIATSAGVVVPSQFAQTAAPTLAGTARVGAALTITPGTYTGGTPTLTYKLIRSSDGGATYVEILTLPAGQLTYILTSADMPNPTSYVKMREIATL